MPESTVAPVVVSPDIDSNSASVQDSPGLNRNGTAPNSASVTHIMTTTRKPSRNRSSPR
jgi:hypothetical protein